MNNLLDILHSGAAFTPDKTALRIWRDKRWSEWSWAQFSNEVDLFGASLVGLEHKFGQPVAIMSSNLPEWTVADMSILGSGGVVVPIYPSSTYDQAAYIIKDSKAEILIVSQLEQVRVALQLKAVGVVKHVIVLDFYSIQNKLSESEVDELILYSDMLNASLASSADEYGNRRSQISPDSLATLIYTSGTTGDPKGVMLSHDNFMHQFKLHDDHLGTDIKMDSLALLPLSHVFERAWTFYVLYRGGRNTYIENPNDLQRSLARFSPTVMCAVPRVYEKMYTTIFTRVASAPKSKRVMFNWAVKVGREWVCASSKGGSVSPLLELKYLIAKSLVLDKIKAKLFPKAEMLPCSGAKLADEVNMFFQALGVPIAYGYGMTETTATISCYTSGRMKLGTAGDVIKGLEIKISDDGNSEIMVRGRTVMQGYYNNPEATAQTLNSEGWLKTGDAGYVEDGCLVLTERIKDLMKTSNGKYIAPQQVEGALIQEPLFEQVAVIADCKKFVSALIVPAFEALEQYARELGVAFKTRAELLENHVIQQLMMTRLNEAQKHLAHFEQVKVFKLLPREFCMKRGELTPTLKVRRRNVEASFAKQIREMYNEKHHL